VCAPKTAGRNSKQLEYANIPESESRGQRERPVLRQKRGQQTHDNSQAIQDQLNGLNVGYVTQTSGITVNREDFTVIMEADLKFFATFEKKYL